MYNAHTSTVTHIRWWREQKIRQIGGSHLLNINGNKKPSNCKHKRDLTHNKIPIKSVSRRTKGKQWKRTATTTTRTKKKQIKPFHDFRLLVKCVSIGKISLRVELSKFAWKSFANKNLQTRCQMDALIAILFRINLIAIERKKTDEEILHKRFNITWRDERARLKCCGFFWNVLLHLSLLF